MPLTVGRVLSERYTIEALIGRGGMGAVYRAQALNLDLTVVVKENLDTSKESQKQFLLEASLLARLSHPNLPRVIDHLVIPGQGQYLVMDYVEGEDLQTIVDREGPVPVDRVVKWASQILDALDYLHNQLPPVIHRDIKPANIKITTNNCAMLVDFGIAKVSAPLVATQFGARAVTPGYSPPEQYGRGSTDCRSDIYALGATLYFLLTGHCLPESLERLSSQTTSVLSSELDLIPRKIRTIIRKAIQVDKDMRYPSAKEMRQALLRANPPRVPPTNLLTESIGAELCPGCGAVLELDIEICPICERNAAWHLLETADISELQPLQISLGCSLEKAADRVFRREVDDIVGNLANVILEKKPIEGKTFALIGQAKVGLSTVAKKLKSLDKNSRLLTAVVYLVGANEGEDLVVFLLQRTLNAIRQSRRLLSWRIGRKVDESCRKSTQARKKNRPDTFVTQLEVELEALAIFKFRFKGNAEPVGPSSNSEEPERSRLKELAQQFDGLITYLLDQGIRIRLVFDGLNDQETFQALLQVIAKLNSLYPGLNSVLVLHEDKLDRYQQDPLTSSAYEGLVKNEFYVPSIENIAQKICNELTGGQAKTETTEYRLLVQYLEFKSCGIPGRVLDILRGGRFYSPVSNSPLDKLLLRTPQLHVRTREQVSEVYVYGTLQSILQECNPMFQRLTERKAHHFKAQLYAALEWMVDQGREKKLLSRKSFYDQISSTLWREEGTRREIVDQVLDRLEENGKIQYRDAEYIDASRCIPTPRLSSQGAWI